MALRIGGKKAAPKEEEVPVPQEKAPVTEEPMPEDLMAELPETLEEEPALEEGGGSVDPLTAGYKGPEQGPFACSNCVFYGGQGEGTCAIVAGPIEPEGLCNLFTSAGAGAEEAVPEETPLPEEPTPEPMPEGEPYPTEE